MLKICFANEMHIVHITAEIAPIAKVGGLSDVLLGLNRELTKRGHRVELVLPFYQSLQRERLTLLTLLPERIDCDYGGRRLGNRVWRAKYDNLWLFLIEPIEASGFFEREHIYGYDDDAYRFTYFSLAALEFLSQTGRCPQLIHIHDWQTAAVAPLVHERVRIPTRCVFTIHNLAYQGCCNDHVLGELGLAAQREKLRDPHHPDQYNLMKGALLYADAITTVSPRYAWEIQTPEGGCGLDGLLREQSHKLSGILNGIDADYWNPEADPHLPAPAAQMKAQLRTQLGLSDAEKPLLACVTRLVTQKGPKLIRQAICRSVQQGAQFVLLGAAADPDTHNEWAAFASDFHEHPDVRICLDQGEALAHQIFAAADMVVVPSLFEPCGLTQMIGLRYGAVPIVRHTGGLADTVFDIENSDQPERARNGFVFEQPDDPSINHAIDRAIRLWKQEPQRWQDLVERCRGIDHSWGQSSRRYEQLYRKLCNNVGYTKAAKHWERFGNQVQHGICLPLASLRCQGGAIGEYSDLLQLIPWMAKVGLSCLQLLPLNDSHDDPSPYFGISSCALHPIYLKLDGLDVGPLARRKRVAYSEILALKMRYLAESSVLAQFSQAELDELLASTPWLKAYARCKCRLEGIAYNAERLEFHARVQLLCRKQLAQARACADEHGVRLIGDLPILVSPHSADVAAHPELFDRSRSVGAPPDRYAKHGQNWSFPLYKWDAHWADDFAWWRMRLAEAERFYHAYRLDHVVGFFRFWAIRQGCKPLEGSFHPEEPEAWLPQGRAILERFLEASELLPIAEDLGDVPNSVRNCLQSLGIPGLCVQRWERRRNTACSLATVSTHDSESLAQWWANYPDEVAALCQDFGWEASQELSMERREALLRTSHRSVSLLHVDLLHEYLGLVPELAWQKAEDDRINVPGTTLKRNWCTRTRASLEEIINSKPLAEKIHSLVH